MITGGVGDLALSLSVCACTGLDGEVCGGDMQGLQSQPGVAARVGVQLGQAQGDSGYVGERITEGHMVAGVTYAVVRVGAHLNRVGLEESGGGRWPRCHGRRCGCGVQSSGEPPRGCFQRISRGSNLRVG